MTGFSPSRLDSSSIHVLHVVPIHRANGSINVGIEIPIDVWNPPAVRSGMVDAR